MTPPAPLTLKVCGMTRQEDVDCAAQAGARMCGFIFHPASPRCCGVERAASLRSSSLIRVGVFVEQSPEEIRDIMTAAQLNMAQLHGPRDAVFTAECARLLGAKRIIRVFWPQRHRTRAGLEDHMRAHAPYCAYFLLDAGQQGGGSGTPLRWAALRQLDAPRPWLLAGGLGPDNALEAAQACSPAGLDFNSGVESAPGQKNHAKLRAALAAGTSYSKDTHHA